MRFILCNYLSFNAKSFLIFSFLIIIISCSDNLNYVPKLVQFEYVKRYNEVDSMIKMDIEIINKALNYDRNDILGRQYYLTGKSSYTIEEYQEIKKKFENDINILKLEVNYLAIIKDSLIADMYKIRNKTFEVEQILNYEYGLKRNYK